MDGIHPCNSMKNREIIALLVLRDAAMGRGHSTDGGVVSAEPDSRWGWKLDWN
jgi:hypothetical protein